MKLHVRWELKRGQLQGPKLTHGRIIDRSSPFKEESLPVGSLYIADLGYLDWGGIAARRAAGSYSLTRAQARTNYWTPEGKPLELGALLPQQVGQTHERWVRVGKEHRHLMRLLIVRVPQDVAERRRANLEADARRRAQPVRQRAWELADWTILLTDALADILSLQGALVLVRERWQMEMLSKLWKQYGRIDEWRTTNPWRVLCELYAKLIGLLLQHWLILLFAWQDEQRRMPQTGSGSSRCGLFSPGSSCRGPLTSPCSPSHPAPDAFRVSIEQAQETSQRCPTPAARLDQLGPGSLSWCVWGVACNSPVLSPVLLINLATIVPNALLAQVEYAAQV